MIAAAQYAANATRQAAQRPQAARAIAHTALAKFGNLAAYVPAFGKVYYDHTPKPGIHGDFSKATGCMVAPVPGSPLGFIDCDCTEAVNETLTAVPGLKDAWQRYGAPDHVAFAVLAPAGKAWPNDSRQDENKHEYLSLRGPGLGLVMTGSIHYSGKGKDARPDGIVYTDNGKDVYQATEAEYDAIKALAAPKAAPAKERPTTSPRTPVLSSTLSALDEVLHYLNYIKADVSRKDWVAVAGIIKDAGGTVNDFDRWSQSDPAKYATNKPEETQIVWDSCKGKNRASGGKLNALAQEQGTGKQATRDWFNRVREQQKSADTEYLPKAYATAKTETISECKPVIDAVSPIGETIDTTTTELRHFHGGLPEPLYDFFINAHRVGHLHDQTPAGLTWHLIGHLADIGKVDPADFNEGDIVSGAAAIGWNTTRDTIHKGLAQMAACLLLWKTEPNKLTIGNTEQDNTLRYGKSQKSTGCQIQPPHRPVQRYGLRPLADALPDLLDHQKRLARQWFFRDIPDLASPDWFDGNQDIADVVDAHDSRLTDEQREVRSKAERAYTQHIADRETRLTLDALLNAPRVPILADREYKNAIDYRDNHRLALVRANPGRKIKFKDALKETGHTSRSALAASNLRTGTVRVPQYREIPVTADNVRQQMERHAAWAVGLPKRKEQASVASFISRDPDGTERETDINSVYSAPERWVKAEKQAGRAVCLKVKTISTEHEATDEERQAMIENHAQDKRQRPRATSKPLTTPSLTIWPSYSPFFVDKQLAMRRLQLVNGDIYDLDTGENLTARLLPQNELSGGQNVYTPVDVFEETAPVMEVPAVLEAIAIVETAFAAPSAPAVLPSPELCAALIQLSVSRVSADLRAQGAFDKPTTGGAIFSKQAGAA